MLCAQSLTKTSNQVLLGKNPTWKLLLDGDYKQHVKECKVVSEDILARETARGLLQGSMVFQGNVRGKEIWVLRMEKEGLNN